MTSGIENHIDWTVPSHPEGERLTRSMSSRRPAKPAPAPQRPTTRSEVMNVLLGTSKLSASDVSGSDPYNATGRHLRR